MSLIHVEHNRTTGVRMEIRDASVLVVARNPIGLKMPLVHAVEFGNEFLRRHNYPPDPANPWSKQMRLAGGMLVFREAFASDVRWLHLTIAPVVEPQNIRHMRQPDRKMEPPFAVLTGNELADMAGKWIAAADVLAAVRATAPVYRAPKVIIAADSRAG